MCISKKIDEWEIEFDGGSPTNDVLLSHGFDVVDKLHKKK